MARRVGRLVVWGAVVSGVLLAACGSPSASTSATATATATVTASPNATATATARLASLSVYYGEGPTVYALNAASGAVRWTHSGFSSAVISVAVANGMVYAATSDRKLIALQASDGSLVWQLSTHLLLPPFILLNGVIYTGSEMYNGDRLVPASDGFVDAYRASDGTKLWEYDGGSCSFNNMAVDATGIYLSGCQQNVLALRASDGAVLWRSQQGPGGGGITAANGSVFVNDYGDIYALDASDGKPLWHVTLGVVGMRGTPPTIASGVMYVTTASAIYALQANSGAQLWSQPGLLAMSPVVDSSTVYVIHALNTGTDTIDALNPTTGSTLWSLKESGEFTNPVSMDGVLYVTLGIGQIALTGYTIYAVHTSDGSVLWQHGNIGEATSVAVG